jgi:hypothetical protein
MSQFFFFSRSSFSKQNSLKTIYLNYELLFIFKLPVLRSSKLFTSQSLYFGILFCTSIFIMLYDRVVYLSACGTIGATQCCSCGISKQLRETNGALLSGTFPGRNLSEITAATLVRLRAKPH